MSQSTTVATQSTTVATQLTNHEKIGKLINKLDDAINKIQWNSDTDIKDLLDVRNEMSEMFQSATLN